MLRSNVEWVVRQTESTPLRRDDKLEWDTFKGVLLSMIIRQAERSDASALSDLTIETYTDAFGYSFSPDDLAVEAHANMFAACFERYIDDDVVLIGEIEGRAVGYVQFGTARPVRRPISN
jgi:hypothetical protein